MEFPELVDGVEVYWLGHAAVKLVDSDDQAFYIDPWSEVMHEADEHPAADIIVATHDHRDHFDVKAIQAVKKPGTMLVCTEESVEQVPEDVSHKVIAPDRSVTVHGKRIRGVPAYNVDKFREAGVPYHEEGFGVGVVFDVDGVTVYHAGDTDPIPAMAELPDIDLAFLPVGGTYTMDQDEAVEAVQMVQPERVAPIHYGTIDGTAADVDRFADDVREQTDAEPVVLERQVP
ncbi:MAG: MBL fold metallo-hydrolase [Candidatus Nanohaloarchaea archaeon]|nr:MBL fold metallo-hydrolase [Candidatus Nanohaloarchaea archaeon]